MIATETIQLEALVKSELPPLPAVAARVAALTQDLNSSARSIADALGCDPSLGARVLRAANSPLYYLERDVTTLTMAVNALGNENLNQLVLASAVVDAFQRKGHTSKVETTLWEHSIAVGLAARHIMMLLGLRGTEQGFICGLLHDIGKLLLLRYSPEAYCQLISDYKEGDFLSDERAIFGYTHAQVGAYAAQTWSLPNAITQAISAHHEPSQAEHNVLTARVIDVADALANQGGMGLCAASDRDLMEWESVIALRLTREQLTEVWETTEKGVSATLALFSR
jgi:putative nucleotidyltransferase with HDIG domain